MLTRKQRLLAVALSCAIVAIAAAASTTQVTHGIDLAGIDRAVAPGDDFFAYANGTWDKSAEIPADRSSWGVSGELTEKTNQQVRELLEGAASGTAAPGSNAQKVGDFYASYMGEAAIEAKGIAPLKPEFTRIAAIKDAHSLSAYLGSMLRADVDALNNTNFYTPNLFGVWITQAFDDPKRNVPFLLQGGHGSCGIGRERAGRDLEGLSRSAPDRGSRQCVAEGFRRREFCVLRHRAQRHAKDSRSLETRGRCNQQCTRRGGRPDLRREIFSAFVQGQDRGDGAGSDPRIPRTR